MTFIHKICMNCIALYQQVRLFLWCLTWNLFNLVWSQNKHLLSWKLSLTFDNGFCCVVIGLSRVSINDTWVEIQLALTCFPNNIYFLKVRNRNTRKRSEVCSKLTIKTLERQQWRRSGVFIVNFEHISHLFLVFLLLALNKEMLPGFVK